MNWLLAVKQIDEEKKTAKKLAPLSNLEQQKFLKFDKTLEVDDDAL